MKKTLVRLIILSGFLLLMTTPLAENKAFSANWLPGWSNRVSLTIDHSKIDKPLFDFPIMVYLGESSGMSSEDVTIIFDVLRTDANRKKITFTMADGVTQCYAEIEKWDTAGKQAWIWVKVPYISNIDHTVLYLYFDRNRMDNTAMIGDTGSIPGQNVWDSDHKLVLHLAEKVTDIPGEYKDSTHNQHHGQGAGWGDTPRGPGTAPMQVSTILGDGQFFNGSTDYITVPDQDDFSLSDTGLTVSWWFHPTVLVWRHSSGEGYINMLGKGGYPNGWEWSFTLGLAGSTYKDQQLAFYVGKAAGGIHTGGGYIRRYRVSDWIYVVGRLDDTNVYLTAYYPDGHSATDYSNYHTWAGLDNSPTNTWSPITLGTIVTQWQMFEGVIDELRVSSVYRSDAWLKASYFSESDKLIIFKLEGNQPPVLNPIGGKTINERERLSFTVSAVDPDEDSLTYSAHNLPEGAFFDPLTRTFSWTPEAGQEGTYSGIHFEVSDGTFIMFEEITITVNAARIGTISPLDITPAGAPGVEEEQPSRRVLFIVIGVAVVLITITAVIILFRTERLRRNR